MKKITYIFLVILLSSISCSKMDTNQFQTNNDEHYVEIYSNETDEANNQYKGTNVMHGELGSIASSDSY